MKIPTITGIIDRRVLVNYAVDPDIAKTIVPAPFKPKIINGNAIAGICLIRLKNVRPKGLPAFMGFGSENGAHRIAVEWMVGDKLEEGVYIPRRDTSYRVNTLLGGRVFPGKHFKAKFEVNENAGKYHIAFKSSDDTIISVDAQLTDKFNPNSIFRDLATASAFFQAGSTGYSPNGSIYEGLYLNTQTWQVKPLEVSQVISSYFEDEKIFPKGSVRFDNALLMTNTRHEWWSVHDKPACY